MLHRSAFRGAVSAEATRQRIARTGIVGRHHVWTASEVEVLQRWLSDGYDTCCSYLPGRSRAAIKSKARGLGSVAKITDGRKPTLRSSNAFCSLGIQG